MSSRFRAGAVLVSELLLVGVALLAIRDAWVGDFFMDLPYFSRVGVQLVSTGWADVFSRPELQVGPLALLLYGLVTRVTGEILFISGTTTMSVLIQVGYCVGLVAASRSLRSGQEKRLHWLDAALVVWAVSMALPWTAFYTGHFMEGAIPLLWIAVARSASKDRPEQAGLYLLLAFGLKAWGGLGVGLLLFTPRLARSMRGVVILGVGAMLMYVPFFLWGSVQTFSFRWKVRDPGPAVSWFLEPGTTAGWSLRLAQAVVVMGIGVLLTLRARNSPSIHVLWATPLAMVIARLALDPVGYWYYWLAVQTLALVGLRCLSGTPRKVSLGTFVIGSGLTLTLFASPLVSAFGALLACGAAWRETATQPPLPPLTTTV